MADQQHLHDKQDTLRNARLANERESSHQTLTLADGRLLGFAIYGASTGPTVFYLHGFGDCRLTAALFDEHAKKVTARVIGIDRPGSGLSSLQLGRTVLDFVEDVQELVAHLKLKSYSIVGVSGGGPYVLACAYALPSEQLTGVTMLAAIGPWEMTLKYSSWITWLVFEARRCSPVLNRWMDGKAMRRYREMTREEFIAAYKAETQGWLGWFVGLHEKDLALLQDDDFLAFMFDGLKENSHRDVEGAVDEWRVMSTNDLGFGLEDIRRDLRMELWYGKHDTSVSWKVGEALQKAIGGGARLSVRDEAHVSILMNCRIEVLERALEGL